MVPIIAFDIGSTLIHPDMGVLSSIIGIEATDTNRRRLARAFTYALEADQRVLPDGDWATRQGHELLRLLDLGDQNSVTKARDVWLKIHDAGGSGSRLYTELDPDAHRVLTALRNGGCRLVAASNSDGTLRAELEQFGLDKYFEYFIDSYDIGVEKPDSQFFAHIMALFSKDQLEATWYVGNDLTRDVLGALMAGFRHAVLYDRADAYPKLKIGYRLRRLVELLPLVRFEREEKVNP